MTQPAAGSGSADRARHAAAQLLASIYLLTGECMSPILERGWKVLVEPLTRPFQHGGVILLDSTGGCFPPAVGNAP